MKEIADILKAYHIAEKERKRTALATVVKVEGSSYRRAGARMLVTEDGQLTGAISGGCLEGDALRKARAAIHQQENKLVTYDTTDEDDARLGVQLGCNGIVYILFEPINTADELHPIALLTAVQEQRKDSVLAVLFSLHDQQQPGTCMFLNTDQLLIKGNISKKNSKITGQLRADAHRVLERKGSVVKSYRIDDVASEALLEFIPPPISLIIAGAGNDAQPLAQMAWLLGWEVMVVDGRPTHATATRFPHAKEVWVAKPAQLMEKIIIDEQTAFVLMTHNYNYDMELLNLLMDTSTRYIGSLGPRKKLIRMLEELDRDESRKEQRLHGPVGLDIGAETAEEIAISILSEIKAVFSGASAIPLKDKKTAIHIHEIIQG
ncbi:hypothetical protein PBAL39_00592 [Pedobacter sp. BAL39]|uniref:XdhC family protein n=1 Tax=Pedobacter sp. BAL39 TaxID=391596 RepID=UPI0001559B82|nr:XdhC/CoxI family protein [Pedobacter sp. BAL39]EDM38067.1 hypothetical protein PBAL39_00592 [Pedobacter sp. BAL39]